MAAILKVVNSYVLRQYVCSCYNKMLISKEVTSKSYKNTDPFSFRFECRYRLAAYILSIGQYLQVLGYLTVIRFETNLERMQRRRSGEVIDQCTISKEMIKMIKWLDVLGKVLCARKKSCNSSWNVVKRFKCQCNQRLLPWYHFFQIITQCVRIS